MTENRRRWRALSADRALARTAENIARGMSERLKGANESAGEGEEIPVATIAGWFSLQSTIYSSNSERIPPFTAGVNRVTRLLSLPSSTGPKPQRLVRTESYVFPRVTSAFGTCAEVRDALKPTSWVFRGEGSHGRMDHGSSDAGFASFASTVNRPTGRLSVTEPSMPRGMTAWVRDALRNRASMTRLRMGVHVAVPQDAPDRGTKPVPPTSGETVLKPARQQAGFPRAGEAPSFTTGRTSLNSRRDESGGL